MLFTLIAFAVALGILITFHELGHYWAARACGVKVLRFSVGFGRVLARRRDRHGTEWALSAIPLGGYVKMLDDPEPGAPDGRGDRAFNTQPVSRRFVIVAAGPVFNLVLAALLYAGLYTAGTQEPSPVVAAPEAGTPAAQAGFAAGDRIVTVDGRPVASWNQARWALLDLLSAGGSAGIEVETADGARTVRELALPGGTDAGSEDPLAAAGLELTAPQPVVRGVMEGGAGAEAGLRAGDRIVAADGQREPDASSLLRIIQDHAGRPLKLGLLRDGTALEVTLVPRPEAGEDGRTVGRIGVQLGGDLAMVTVRYGVGESLLRGAQRTWETAWFSLRTMGRMLVGEASWRNISGPVTIADYAGQTARIGLAAYVAFLALVSVSLGVLNLLPIPMLDGGHLLYYLIEIVRGSPPPERWLEFGQRAGLGILACLMGLALFNDLARLFT